MAQSSCPKCSKTSFDTNIVTPRGSNFKLLFVQCSSCGAVVGVMDFYNIGARLGEIEEKIDRVRSGSNDSTVLGALDTINRNINNVYQLIQSSQKPNKNNL